MVIPDLLLSEHSEVLQLHSPIPMLDRFPSIWLTTNRFNATPLSLTIRWWNTTLQHMPADSSLSALNLSLNPLADNIHTPLLEAWRDLDLTVSKMKGLKKVSLVDSDCSVITLGNEKIVADARFLLPRLHSRGILVF